MPLYHYCLNVAISALMTCTGKLEAHRYKHGDTLAFIQSRWKFIKLLAPFAPYLTEELWHQLGGQGSVHHARWPVKAEMHMSKTEIEIPVQVNGKIRTRLVIPHDIDTALLESMAMQASEVTAAIGDQPIARIVVVPQRVVNIVLG